MTQKTKDEKSIAGAGYIISFFTDLDIMISNASNYINNISRMKVKYGDITHETQFDPADQQLLTIIENIKTSVFRTYIKFVSLKKKLPEFKNLDVASDKEKTIEELYKSIRDVPVPEITNVELYAMRLNNLFVEAIDILQLAQGLYADIPSGDV